MSKIEHDRPDEHRFNKMVRLGDAGRNVISNVKISVGETTSDGRVQYRPVGDDSPLVDPRLIIRRLNEELAQARLVTAQALADVAAARNALELSIKHQDAQHNEAMARMQVRHDAKVAELDAMITTLVGKLTQARKGHDAVSPVAATLDAVEWGWHAPVGLLPRGMR